jgi:hypothetical protein
LRAAQELLWLATIVTALVPVAHGLATGWWFWRSATAGHGALAAIDLVALVMAVAFATLARATTRRGRSGVPDNVWALPRADAYCESRHPGFDRPGQPEGTGSPLDRPFGR